jgi:type IV secretion/conjugal transfer VirB4 family ATPase
MDPSIFADASSVLNPTSLILKTLAWVSGAGALSLMTATAIPSIHNKMLPPPAHDELWTFLPFRKMSPDRKTIVCAENRHMRVIELEGAELTLAGDDQHELLYEARKAWLDELERFGIDHVKIFTLKQKIGLIRTMRSTNPVVRAMDHEWEKNFKTPTKMTHYVVIVAKGKSLDDTRSALDSAEDHTMAALSDYHPSILIDPEKITIDDFDDPDRRPSGPLKPFAHILSPITRHNPLAMDCRGPLSALLTAETIDFSKVGRGLIQFQNGTDKRFSCVMTWRDCGDKTSEAIMSEISALDYELIIYHAIQPIDQTIALATLKQREKSAPAMHLSKNAAPAFSEAIRQVEGLTGDRAGLTFYAMHVMPICETEEDLNKAQKEITRIMSRTTGTAVCLKSMAQPTYLSMVDPAQAWPRKFRFLTSNVAASVYPQRSLRGNLRSDWGPEPVAWLRTISGDPYPFQFHDSDKDAAAGHTVVIGATGAGKTTLTCFLAAQSMRIPRLKVILFDRLYGMKVFCNCAGGNYVDFDGARNKAIFNPLLMPNTDKNKTFLLNWMKEITNVNDNGSIAEFARMIDLVYGRNELPNNMRSLKALANAAFSPNGPARAALTPWVEDNQYGNIFNAPADTLNLTDTKLSGFNMTQILNDEKLAPAVVSYLVHRIQNMSYETGDPTLLLVDETAPMLKNELFSSRFLDAGLMEGRKLRQVYILCFQTPQALYNTGRSQIILDQCVTKIFFRMYRDSDDAIEQYEPFGLNQAEKDFLGRKTFKNFKYGVLIKKANGESAIADANLSQLGYLLRTLDSNVESSNRIERLLTHMPRDRAIQTYLTESVHI